MSINQVALRNFKCFKSVKVDFSKITLLTGENSSGKSSLIYGLLSGFQSKRFPFYLSPNGKYVNMGDFMEMSFGNHRDNEIGIDLSLTIDKRVCDLETSWGRDTRTDMPRLNCLKVASIANLEVKASDDAGYTVRFDYPDGNNAEYIEIHNLKIGKAVYSLFESGEQIPFEKSLDTKEEKETSEQKLPFQRMKRACLEINNMDSLATKHLDELEDELFRADNEGAVLIVKQLSRIVARLAEIFEDIGDNLNLVSSFRLPPARSYDRKLSYDNRVGRFGENYIDQILEWHSKRADEFDELKSILDRLGLLNSIDARKLGGGKMELRVQVKDQGVWASLTDVGFGISQFLPIIVADLQLSRNSTLAVAQPEIHLHPSVQATMGDYFIEQVAEEGKRYVIETHSEYLLNRIRLRIAEGKIKASDVSVYYFENSPGGSIKHQVEFAQDGQIKGAPQTFFDTYMMDVMDIALNA